MTQHPNQLAYSKRWRAKNKERWEVIRADAKHMSMYGISLRERELIFEDQGWACAICGITKPTTTRKWHIDHDHKSNRVRGILCHSCNLMLGHAKDDVSLLRKAITYLEKGNASSRKG